MLNYYFLIQKVLMVKKVVKKRASVVRELNSWTMSEAEFRSFIISALRGASRYWKPKAQAIKRARVGKGRYKCEACWKEGGLTLPPLPGNKRKRKNIQADHFSPVVPISWFEWFDSWVKRCFIEADWYQAICWECHTIKTKEENKERKLYKTKN